MLKKIFSSTIPALLLASAVVSAAPTESADCSSLESLKPLAEKKLKTEEGYQAALQLAACYAASGDTANLDRLSSRFLEFYAGNPKRSRMEVIAAERMLANDSSVT